MKLWSNLLTSSFRIRNSECFNLCHLSTCLCDCICMHMFVWFPIGYPKNWMVCNFTWPNLWLLKTLFPTHTKIQSKHIDGSHLFTKLIVFFVLKLVRTLFDHDEIWVCLNIGDPKKPMVCHHSTHVLFWVYQSVSPIDTTICWDWHSPTWLDLHFDEELPSNCVVLEISCSQNWFENV